MIPLELFDYSNFKNINIKVTKYVNKNLEIIVRVLLDILRSDPDFELDSFFPRDYLEKKPYECRRLVDELYELICSDVIRDYIKPKYEYLLYCIIEWWDDCTDDEEDLLPNKLDKKLLKEIESEESYISEDGKNMTLDYITTFEWYYDICFLDHDFLPSQLSNMLTIYIRNTELFNMIYNDVDLDDYVDLMPCDLRELYIEKQNNYKKSYEEMIKIEDDIVIEIICVLQLLELRVCEIEDRDEVEISNDIYSTLVRTLKVKFDLEITREMTIGRARKKLGETDLYIYRNNSTYKIDYAIIENKYIEKFISQYQQLLGYLNQNFKFGITISINKRLKLEDCMNKIVENLIEIKNSDNDFKITKIYKPFKDFPYVIKSKHIIPEDSEREMSIYHLILNLNDDKRSEIAKSARKK